MKALIVYESMYGNTHLIAEQIASGLQSEGEVEVEVVPVGEATTERVLGADLLVVGGPTHVHGMTTKTSRRAAADAAAKPAAVVTLDPDAEGEALRDWFDTLPSSNRRLAAAFDTRMSGPALLTGRASLGINRRLHRHGYSMIVEPESFIVSKDIHLLPAEIDHARTWGTSVATAAKAPVEHRQ